MTEFKISKTPEYDEARKGSEFYCDGYAHTWVASVEVEGLPVVHVYCDGEMRLHINNEDQGTDVIRYSHDFPEWLNSDEAMAEAVENEKIEFHNNPWFDLYQETGNFPDLEHLDCVGGDIDEMIELAKLTLTGQLETDEFSDTMVIER